MFALVRRAKVEVLRQELQLTQAALVNSPKSYCCWFYRKHLVGMGLVGFQSELALCDKFLAMDSRNCELGTALLAGRNFNVL